MSYQPALFAYAVQPDVVRCSGSASPDTASLFLAVNNDTATHRDCPQLIFVLPVGTGAGDLTADPAGLTATVADGTSWAIESDGSGTFTAMPQPPATGLDAGESVAFSISGLVVNELPGLAEIAVYEQTDEVREALLAVTKLPQPAGTAS